MKNRSFGYVASGLSAFLAFGSVWASEEGGQVYELEALKVVSTGTRTERLSKEAPVRTEVLSSQLFDDAATRDLGAAIEYLPGIRSEANCQNCGTAEIKMLGLGAGYSQLLFDSQPLFSGLASVYGIEHIPTAFIERLEVVKGGASSLYGPGAVAGVVNILPREPVANKFRQDVSVEDVDGATFFSSSLVRDWTSERGDQAVSLYLQYNDSEAVDLNDDGFSDITQKEFYTLGTNAWFYPTENGRLSLNYSYSWEERRGGDRFDLRPHETQITERLEHNWHRGGLTWEGNNENGLFYRLSGSMSYVDRHSYYGGVGDVALPGMDGFEASTYQAAVEDSRLLYGFSDTTRHYLEALFSQSVGEHYLSWGAQYQYDEVFDEKRDELGQSLISDGSLAGFVGEDPIASGDFSDLGFFFQDEWMPAEKMTVVMGLRIDKHSELSAWTASPR
ncbi:MAG: TonB-dependent receptor, partial [Verrucomicrobiota bacterium]